MLALPSGIYYFLLCAKSIIIFEIIYRTEANKIKKTQRISNPELNRFSFSFLGGFDKNSKNFSQMTKQQQAYSGIVKLLLDGHFKPGDKLNQWELARELGVSMTPIREALNRLASNGTITSQHRSGFILPYRDVKYAIDMLNLWQSLNILGVTWAIERCSDLELFNLVREMRKLQVDLQSVADTGDSSQFRLLLFYETGLMMQASGSVNLSEIMETLWVRYAIPLQYDKESMLAKLEYRNKLIAAIESKDISAAKDAIARSIEISMSVAMHYFDNQNIYR